MKALKIVMVILIAAATILPLTVKDSQAATWYTCWVNAIGGGSTGKYVALTDTSATPAFTNQYFTIDPKDVTPMTAEALTAMASGLKISVYASGIGGIVTYMYMLSQ